MTDSKATAPTLSPLLKFFIGLDLTVELKNGRKFYGKLDSADGMNLVLTRATRGQNLAEKQPQLQNDIQGSDDLLEYNMLHIRGSSIRYVIFPNRADLPKLIKLGADRERGARERYARGKRPAK